MPNRDELKNKFSRDLVWNLIAFAILGISGILLNIIIARYYDASVLGVFNQVFALHIFFSQFAVFGLQFSALKYVSEFADQPGDCDPIISASLMGSALLASFFVSLGWLLSGLFGKVFASSGVEQGFLYVLPGVWFFALNKVLINILNGFRAMRAFAIAQSSRFLLLLTGAVACAWNGVPGEYLAIIISVTELMLFIALMTYTSRFYRLTWNSDVFDWLVRHVSFGLRGFLSGTMSELNTRVDIVMLGLFLSDKAVGIYSMASLVAEGVAQLAIVLRNNINPLITQYATQKRFEDLKELTGRVVKGSYVLMLLVVSAAITIYPYFVEIMVGGVEFQSSWSLFIVLALGVLFSSGYLPLEMFLVQSGYPVQQTQVKAYVLLTNFVLNLCLIPIFGLIGAAVATAGAYIFSAIYLKFLVSKVMNLKI